MKKVLFLLIALFTYGNMCKAQGSIPGGKALEASKQPAMKKVMAKESAAGDTYWYSARSYFKENGDFSFDKGLVHTYKAQFDFDGEEVTITNLVDNSNYNMATNLTIKGYYDADDKSIIVSTPDYSSSRSLSEYAQVGTYYYYGEELTAVLLAGDWSYNEDTGLYDFTMKGQLVFDVSDDLSTITPRTAFTSYAIRSNGEGAGFLNSYPAAPYRKSTEEATLIMAPTSIELDPLANYLFPGTEYVGDVTLTNIGKVGTNYTATSSNPDIIPMRKSGTIAAEYSAELTFTVAPSVEGDIEGDITYTTENGSTAVLHVKAFSHERPAYESIVKEGEFYFETAGDAPFLVTDEVTGSPVAISTNSGDNTQSSLIVSFTVPEGSTGLVSWKAFGHATQPNGPEIILNGNTLYSNRYNSSEDLYDASSARVLTAGDYTLEFINYTDQDWYEKGFKKDPIELYVYDLSLVTVPTTEHAAHLINEKADFGYQYIDKLSVMGSQTVQLVNMGTEPLEVTGIVGDDHFSGIVPTASAIYMGMLDVTLTFEGDEAKEYTGTVTIQTNAGDFTVDCSALTEAIPVDFSPIVKEGEFSFNTSTYHPFYVEGTHAYSSTAYQPIDGNKYSWLEASFVVPEGQKGTLSWKAYNSSDVGVNFMGQIQVNDGTFITIDNEVQKAFDGEKDASSTNFDEKDLTFGPGRHSVMFLYQKKYLVPKGDDRVDLYNLRLKTEEIPVNEAAAENDAVTFPSVRYGRKSYATVNLYNSGANDLKVNAITGNASFGGIIPTETAKTFKSLPVQLCYTPQAEGEDNADVIISTTAGDITIHCSAEALELGGTPLYNEEFEDGYADWTFIDADEDGTCWVTATSQDSPNDLHRGYQSREAIVSVGWDIKRQQSHTPDNWAITPAITLPESGQPALIYFFSVRGNETHDVLVGSGNDISTYTSVFSNTKSSYANDPDNAWTEQEVDLSDYAGQSVNIAFRHYAAQYWVSIDGVLVYDKAPQHETAIGQVNVSEGKTEIYSIDGRSRQQMGKGLNILRTTDANGNTVVRKVNIQ